MDRTLNHGLPGNSSERLADMKRHCARFFNSLGPSPLIIWLFFVAAVSASAQLVVTSSADSGAGTLRQAVSDATSGNTITFSHTLSGQTIMLTSGQITVDKDLTISASGVDIVVDGGTNDRHFWFRWDTTNVLEGLTLTNGYSGGRGGAVESYGTLTISNCIFVGNSANDGGAIYSGSDTLTISDTTLSNNTAASRGGGIYNDEGTVSVVFSALQGNHASVDGGGIYGSEGSLTLSNVSVYANHAEYNDGGGINVKSGACSLYNVTLSANTSEGSGGGIFFSLGTLEVSESIISSNTSYQFGGGVDCHSGTLTVSNSTLRANFAEAAGGGISAWNGTLAVASSTLSTNSSYTGGGMDISSSTVTIDRSTFSGNSAEYSGGGIYTSYCILTISNSTLSENTSAFASGGALFNFSDALTMDGLLAASGTSSCTDHIPHDSTETLSRTVLNQCTLANNRSTGVGGAVCNFRGWTFLTNCTVVSNTSSDGAGAWTAGDASTKAVVASTIIAGNRGGVDLALGMFPVPDAFLSRGCNLIGSGSVTYFSAPGDTTNLTSAAIQLAPLGSYGGPTETMPPLPGSPAIDSGDNTGTLFETDQRGFPRVTNGRVDIGAVESQRWSDVARFWTTDWDNDGNQFGIEFALGTDWFIPDTTNTANLGMILSGGHLGVSFGFNPDATNYAGHIGDRHSSCPGTCPIAAIREW